MSALPTVLIVEDDPQLNQLFGITLKNQFEIIQTHNGQEALDILEKRIPNLIVLDMNLPGVPGAKILSHVRANTRFADTRIILATADSQQADLLSKDADIVLLKPISPTQLRELAGRLMR